MSLLWRNSRKLRVTLFIRLYSVTIIILVLIIVVCSYSHLTCVQHTWIRHSIFEERCCCCRGTQARRRRRGRCCVRRAARCSWARGSPETELRIRKEPRLRC
jgi:hypothetical protein